MAGSFFVLITPEDTFIRTHLKQHVFQVLWEATCLLSDHSRVLNCYLTCIHSRTYTHRVVGRSHGHFITPLSQDYQVKGVVEKKIFIHSHSKLYLATGSFLVEVRQVHSQIAV